MVWRGTPKDLKAIAEIQQLKKNLSDLKIPGGINEMNPELDKAGRVADFIELGRTYVPRCIEQGRKLVAISAKNTKLKRVKLLRHDDKFMYVAAWEYKADHEWQLHKEVLEYEEVKPSQRSYK